MFSLLLHALFWPSSTRIVIGCSGIFYCIRLDAFRRFCFEPLLGARKYKNQVKFFRLIQKVHFVPAEYIFFQIVIDYIIVLKKRLPTERTRSIKRIQVEGKTGKTILIDF